MAAATSTAPPAPYPNRAEVGPPESSVAHALPSPPAAPSVGSAAAPARGVGALVMEAPPPPPAAALPVAEGLAPALSVPVGEPLPEPVPVPVAEPLGVPLALGVGGAEAVTEGEAPRDREGVAGADSVALAEGVGEPVPVPLPVGLPVEAPVGVGLDEAVADALPLGGALPLLEGEAPALREAV